MKPNTDRAQSRATAADTAVVRCVVVDYNTPAMVRRFVSAIIAAGVPGNAVTVVQNYPAALRRTRTSVPDSIRVVAGRPNYGYAAGVNAGLGQAEADWYLVANSDVVIGRHALATLLASGRDNPRCAVIGGRLVSDRGRPLPSVIKEHSAMDVLGSLWPPALGLPAPIRPWLSAHREATAGPVAAVVGAAMLVRGQALRQVGPMDEKYVMFCEEVDWARRFRDGGWEVRYCPEAEIVHTGSVAVSREHDRHQVRLVASKLRYIKQHRGWLGYLAARAAVVVAAPALLLAAALGQATAGDRSGRRHAALVGTALRAPW